MNSYNLSRLTVLVIERHAPMRRVFREVFRELGVGTLLEAHNTEDAYKIFRRNVPDLIFTDWSPHTDALSLLKMVRLGGNSENPFVPVVVASAFTERHNVCAARDAGMSEFLAKPISPRLIYYRIQAIIEKNRPFIKVNNHYFGPDRRRRRSEFSGQDQRKHKNVTFEDRRLKQHPFKGRERRQGYPGYAEPDRRIGMRDGKRFSKRHQPTVGKPDSQTGLSANNFRGR